MLDTPGFHIVDDGYHYADTASDSVVCCWLLMPKEVRNGLPNSKHGPGACSSFGLSIPVPHIPEFVQTIRFTPAHQYSPLATHHP